jgi:hypothetical protein
VVIDPSQEPLTVDDIQNALRKAWPSIDPETINFVSGSTIRSAIWNFVVECTLTTNPIIYNEKAGGARMTFVLRIPGLKPLDIKKGTADNIASVHAFIRLCKMYMNGVAAAIERSGEDPPPTPEASIFKIT